MEVPHLPPDHPWYFLNQYGVPNVKWCEQTVMSWVAEPANTWSNLAFVFAGILLLMRARKNGLLYTRRFGWALVIVGFCSGIYHASSTYVFQILDFFAMFIVAFLPLFLNFRRLDWVKERQFSWQYWSAVVVATLAVPLFGWLGYPIQELVGAAVLGLAITEALIYKRGLRANYRYLWVAVVFIVLSSLASVADVTRFYCHPENHYFQGHALWHVLNSFAIYWCARYYEQFDRDYSTLVRSL